MKLAIFVSGGLGLRCLEYLLNENYNVAVVFTDRKSPEIQSLTRGSGTLLFIGNPRKGNGLNFLKQNAIEVDLIVSINYLFIIEEELITYPRLASINFHGSLLPKYRGRTPHVWAIINNEKHTGITSHFISKGCDEGPIIDQLIIEIAPDNTGQDILNRFSELYPAFIEKTLYLIKNKQAKKKVQDHQKATYFGRRTPEDGEIKWCWQKERIYNWIRAQSFPYPGAFSHYKGIKVIIDEIELCDIGFKYDSPNGLVIIGGNYPVIKTPNGAIKILKTRNGLEFQEGEILI